MAEFDPILLHASNAERLGEDAVVVASYPGAGATLLGNILLELDLNYVDLYTERVGLSGAVAPVPERGEYRRRFAASSANDLRGSQYRAGRIFAKTHRLPIEFGTIADGILLVRDPRDTLFSYYMWRRSFSEEGERRTFKKFLSSDWPLGIRPIEDWIAFHRHWLERLEQLGNVTIISFESLKESPINVIQRTLRKLGVERSERAVARAVAASSFSKMRAHEDRHARDRTRVMRSGRVAEWKDWYDETYRSLLDADGLVPVVQALGYPVPWSRKPETDGEVPAGI